MLTARTRKRWLLPERAVEVHPSVTNPPHAAAEAGLAAEAAGTHQHPLLQRLLAQRGIHTAEQADRFLSPKLNHLDDPALLPGCAAAAGRIARAIADQRPIVIYGDYDVDGITASAILWHTLRHLGHRGVTTYIPHRLDEGYGLNVEAIRGFAAGGPGDLGAWGFGDLEQGAAPGSRATAGSHPKPPTHQVPKSPPLPLIITVDCGITAVEVAAEAKRLGLELIITDHHHFDVDALPDAAALVHPGLRNAEGGRRKADGSNPQAPSLESTSLASELPPSAFPPPPSTDLCGAGVAFKLAWQVARTHFDTDRLPRDTAELLLDLLALAALGTVADVVPLVGENRVITVHGLSRIKHTRFLGLNALVDAANLRNETIDAYHVGFVLGPRLNACGRMGHAKDALKLLTDASPVQAKELAAFLTKENDRRRATERRMMEQARAMVVERGDDAPDRRAIVLAHPDWHPGVVGIVASRIVEAFHRPAILLGIDPDTGHAKGSARSVDRVDLHAAISQASRHCLKFGGHAMAAGLTLPTENIDAFRDDVVVAVNAMIGEDDLLPTLRADAELGLCDCTCALFDVLRRLAPFGRSNPEPRLLIRNVVVARAAQRMGTQGKHLSVSLRDADGRASLRAVGFDLGDLADEFPAGVAVEAIAKPKTNTWRGVTSPELHLLDIRVVS